MYVIGCLQFGKIVITDFCESSRCRWQAYWS